MPKERYERLNELLYFSATKWHTVLSIRLGSLEITISSPFHHFSLFVTLCAGYLYLLYLICFKQEKNKQIRRKQLLS